MTPTTCPVCGGKLNIRLGAEYAVCGSCGNTCECDPADIARFRAVYRSAERAMRLNTAAGCREAIARLETIPFVEGSEDLSAECERRLDELRSNRLRQQERDKLTDRKNTALGVALLIAALVFCAAAVAGAVYLVVCLINGTFSPVSLAVAAGAALLAAVVILAGKAR